MAILTLIVLLCPAVFASEETAGQLHEKGVALFGQKDFAAAREALIKLISRFPDSSYAADAIFKTGESFYREAKYNKAGGYFRLYMERYALAGNIRDAKFRLNQCEEKIGRKIPAVQPKMEMMKGPLRAVRVKHFYQGSLPAVDRSIAALKKKGVNTLIVPGFKLFSLIPHRFLDKSVPPGAYFDNPVVPLCQNLLPGLVAMTHKYGMRLFVEFPIRSMPGMPRDAGWDIAQKVPKISYKSDLFSPDAAGMYEKAAKALAKISIDGILLVDLAISPGEGFSEWAMAAYEEQLGKRPDMERLFDKTTGSPSDQIAKISEIKGKRTSFVAGTIAKSALSQNPNLEIWVQISPKAIKEPATGLLKQGIEVETLVNTPFNGVYFELDLLDIFSAGTLTSIGVSDSIERLCRSASAISGDISRTTLGLVIEDELRKKAAPAWQIKSVITSAKLCGIENFAAGPLKYGFDFKQVFYEPFVDLKER